MSKRSRNKEENDGLEQLTSSEFEREVERVQGRVVVDFYADWCAPCRQVVPALEELAAKWRGTIRFVKVDIDDSRDIADKYIVWSIPTIMLFEGGKVAAQTTGVRPAHAIEHELGLAQDRVA